MLLLVSTFPQSYPLTRGLHAARALCDSHAAHALREARLREARLREELLLAALRHGDVIDKEADAALGDNVGDA